MRPHALDPGTIQGKEGIKFCYLATLDGTPLIRPTILLFFPKADPTSEADDFANEVCKAKGLPVYTRTVSHGAGALKVTLDLYTTEE